MIFDVIKKAKQLLYDDSNTGLGVNNVQDAIDNLTQAIVEVDAVNEGSGESILLTDTLDDTVLDFKAYGKSVQDGEPTPDSPVDIVRGAANGYFDGELMTGFYSATGSYVQQSAYVCSKNPIPCNGDDTVKVIYATISSEITLIFYDKDMNFISRLYDVNVTEYEEIAPTNAKYVHFYLGEPDTVITPSTAKPITVTINNKYALIVKSVGAYEGELAQGYYSVSNNGQFVSSNGAKSNLNPILCNSGDMVTVKANCENVSSIRVLFFTDSGSFISGGNNDNTNEITLIAPTNASYYHFSILTTNAIEYIFVGLNAIKYIPLNEPLRSSLDGTVTDEVSLTEVNRRFKEVVFDGSSDENWMTAGEGNTQRFYLNVKIAKPTSHDKVANILCDKFTPNTVNYILLDQSGKENCIGVNGIGNILVRYEEITTVVEWRAWLQANPITVQYELAEPVVETIEPVDIVTYDNTTYITNPDNADMWVEYYSNSSVGQRLAKTDEQMRAIQTELDNLIPTTTGTDAVFCKSGNVVVLHLNGVTTRIDNKSRCVLDISRDTFAQFPPVYVSATKPAQYPVIFRDSETNAVSTAVAKIIQDNGIYYVQILPIMSGTLADNAEGTVNGTITYLTDRSI